MLKILGQVNNISMIEIISLKVQPSVPVFLSCWTVIDSTIKILCLSVQDRCCNKQEDKGIEKQSSAHFDVF